MDKLIENHSLRNRVSVFSDRVDAGRKLCEKLKEHKDSDALLLAIPSGGVPVAKELRDALTLDLDLIIVRKIQIPWNPEAGFGAVNLDGDLILNRELLLSLNLSEDLINLQIKKAMETVEKRNDLFRKGREFPTINNRPVIIVDDGLASGYTMRAALKYVGKRNPSVRIIAVPTGSHKTIQHLTPETDIIVCLNVREGFPFAVAEAYRNWNDLSDQDVLRELGNP